MTSTTMVIELPSYALHQRGLFEELVVSQPVKTFSAFHGTRTFITYLQEPVTEPCHEPVETDSRHT
jgi:hypothetical protein